MTTAEVKDAAKAFQAGNLTFQNLTVKTTDNKQVDFDEVATVTALDSLSPLLLRLPVTRGLLHSRFLRARPLALAP